MTREVSFEDLKARFAVKNKPLRKFGLAEKDNQKARAQEQFERDNEKARVIDRLLGESMPIPQHMLNPEVYMMRSMEYDTRV